MPGRGPQTFKKRQKEQERRERQQEKFAKRQQRKAEKDSGVPGQDDSIAWDHYEDSDLEHLKPPVSVIREAAHS
jgi:hypothetical protein